MEILEGLTEEQREAVTHGVGPLLVLAGVGTGKTTVIARRIAYLIAAGFVKRPSQLLVFTFSNQAAEEMLDRAFEWIRYAALDAWVATYHSVCERILRENAPLAGLPPDFRVLDEWDQRLFLLDHLTELPLRRLRPQALRRPLSFLSPILSLIQRAKDEALSPADYLRWWETAQDSLPPDERELHRELAEIYQAYQELLAKEGVVDFGDLILRCVDLLHNHPGLLAEYHERFPYVLADEFQDTSRAELRLVTLLAGHGNVTVVGDDDQAIYGFRGVPWDNLLAFLRAFPHSKVVVLTNNFRSTQKILDCAVRLIRQNAYRLEALSIRGEIPHSITKELRSPFGPGLAPVHRHFPSVTEEAAYVAEKARELHAEGVAYREMAVLYRNRYRPEPYLRALSEAGVPWTLAGGYRAGLFDQEEIKLVMSFLRVLADPRDDQSLYHLLGSPIYRLESSDLAQLTALSQRTHRSLRALLSQAVEEKSLSPEGLATAQRVLEDLAQCEALARSSPTGQVLYHFLAERTGYLGRLAREVSPRSRRALENIAAFFEEVVRRFEEVARYDRVPWFVRYVEELRELGWNPMVGEADPGADAVQVMTFHQAKGREFEAVFLTGLVEDFFPGRIQRPVFSLPRELVLEDLPSDVAHVEEQRRLFYVGMTRAKRYLFLLSADDYRLPGEEPRRRPAKVSRFVVEALGEEGLGPRAPEAPALFRISRTAQVPEPVLPLRGEGTLQLSFRQVDDWLTCPLKYKYIHVLRVPIRLHPTVILGNAVHQAIQSYHLAKKQGRSLSLAETISVFDRAWRSEGFLSAAHEEELRRHGQEALRHFYAFEEEEGARPTFVEQYFAFEENGVKVIGYWDRVDRRRDGALLIDYKTSEVKVEAADRRVQESLQLAIYALAYERMFGERPKELQLRFLTPEVVVGRAEPTDKLLKWAWECILTAAEGIRREDFQPKPSFTACQYCAYRAICPAALPR
ncbi:MAG: ATP-dependent helicase [Candidatus Bipolaricaulota bacterium]|nr:ATP-dependent helicase [Candidatus Bipolaricaulota bacterium]MDW8127144.1 ATP-dependent DNA helicase [Candidatus Bipolaricaulota bacterium]